MTSAIDLLMPPDALRLVRASPLALVRGAERRGFEAWEVADLQEPLAGLPDAVSAAAAPALGALAPLAERYDWIATMLSVGWRPAEIARWQVAGPTLEAVHLVDAAARVAALYRARLAVLIVDQEDGHNSTRNNGDTGASVIERIGARVQSFFDARHPAAVVLRTSDPSVRGEICARMTSSAVAQLYPNGVATPYGVQGSLWWQLHYLTAVGSVLGRGRTLAVIHHDELRAMRAARRVEPALNAVFVMPVPQLGWQPPRGQHAAAWVSAMIETPRRMFRAPPANHLHVDEPLPIPLGWTHHAAREVAWYLTGDPAYLVDDAMPELETCLAGFRQITSGGGPA